MAYDEYDELDFQEPTQRIPVLGEVTILDFWRWAYSDILNNRNRSIFAEFIVGYALGVVDSPREEWAPYDFDYNGSKIEVKSAAFVQSWKQEKLAIIKFDISQKQEVQEIDGVEYFTDKQIRPADIYVFCLLTDEDMENADVLNIDSWDFYIVPTHHIDEKFGNQKQAALSRIQEVCKPVKYHEIKQVVDVLSRISPNK